ncbi:MAG: MBL fold metallo-hydrolase [Firmicutes bacterium]|nr:MBL fold metallo-hydrolase [Bacillota bacterium]
MALKICSISSSSRGNCIFVGSNKTRLLIDAGVNFNTVKRSLKVLGQDEQPLNVLITHTHSDHISNLKSIQKYTEANVYSYGGSRLNKKMDILYNEFSLESFSIGDILVTPFNLSHDTPCVGFTLESGDSKISFLTDLGEANDDLVNNLYESDLVFLEANHDINMLRLGSYPIHLKRRVLSNEGHLSNDATAIIAEKLVTKGKVKQLILGHLSEQNNTPMLAETTVVRKLSNAGAILGKDFSLEIAPARGLSGLYCVGNKK